MSESEFTEGNLARSRCQQGNSVSFLKSLPFQKIYHNTTLPNDDPEEKDEITFRRHAEVLVPRELPLSGFLHHVFVRSLAEYETLWSLLAENGVKVVAENQARIRVNGQKPLFFKYWSYVERVVTVDDRIRIEFNPSTFTPGPFEARAEIIDPSNREVTWSATKGGFDASKASRIRIPTAWLESAFVFRLFLDDCLAYQSLLDPSGETTILRSLHDG